MRREVEELREGIGKRDAKIKEMHRHIEELEAMVRKMKEEGKPREEKR